VHAVVVAVADVTGQELIEHCRALIAGYKLPKRVELRSEPLPKSGAGKILKRQLREPFWRDRETRVGGPR
jgi:long-chain acyl-CoA synthetase